MPDPEGLSKASRRVHEGFSKGSRRIPFTATSRRIHGDTREGMDKGWTRVPHRNPHGPVYPEEMSGLGALRISYKFITLLAVVGGEGRG